MSQSEDDRVLFDADACNFAFRAGQIVEKILLDRGLATASRRESAVVTVDDVRSTVDDSLLKDLRKHLHERAEQESQMVA